jgi:broad specificity phosphatase PhoE
MAVEILYETHAVSTDNEAGIASGWLPGELSPTGRQLATRRGERHRHPYRRRRVRLRPGSRGPDSPDRRQ